MKNYEMDCAEFINKSTTSFHAVSSIKEKLLSEGFIELKEASTWEIKRGEKYFTSRNCSSIIAFTIGSKCENITFNISASHSDVCTFKIKPETVLQKNNYVQLNTEGYGGMICSTWMDRPLSIGGRLMINSNNKIKEQLFDLHEPCVLIPSVAIHMNREVNDGYKYNKQVDMLPMISLNQKEFDFKKYLANKLNLNEKEISFYDAYLYNPEKCLIWGDNKEFFSGPRLDDLQMAYSALEGFLESNNNKSINVYCCFDNEEVGSRTRQGAASSYLKETLKRIVFKLGYGVDEYYASLSRSFMVSCDNAHALHPNHPEKADELNRPMLNKGVVIKFNASQSYTTDGLSAAYFAHLCNVANVAFQTFTNRSDLVGGGTLGNISASQVSIPSVDIGLAQLAMHSTYETSGMHDIKDCIKVMNAFYDATIHLDDEGSFIV